jgi:hypothetical protein
MLDPDPPEQLMRLALRAIEEIEMAGVVDRFDARVVGFGKDPLQVLLATKSERWLNLEGCRDPHCRRPSPRTGAANRQDAQTPGRSRLSRAASPRPRQHGQVPQHQAQETVTGTVIVSRQGCCLVGQSIRVTTVEPINRFSSPMGLSRMAWT